jgi:MFS family permease
VPWYALGYFLLGGYRASRSFIYAQARPLVHPAQMGLAYGVAETFNSLSMTLAPLLAGILYTHSPVVVYPISLGLVGVAILLTIAFAPRLPVEEPAALSQSLEL